ncbi:hypothetical protein BKA62DRAFT_591460, partial [Auriculariales sp. MPI-PUGE-AT-0066]
LALPPGTPTHTSGSTLDLPFVSSSLEEAILSCTTSPGHGSDHLAIDLTLDLDVSRMPPRTTYRWRSVNWEEYQEALEARIAGSSSLSDSAHVWNDTDALDEDFATFLTIMRETNEQRVPIAKPSPHAKLWWSRKLTTLRKIAGRM